MKTKNKKMTAKSVFSKSWNYVTIIPSFLFSLSQFCSPPEVKFQVFGTSKHGEEKPLSNVVYIVLITTLSRLNRANNKRSVVCTLIIGNLVWGSTNKNCNFAKRVIGIVDKSYYNANTERIFLWSLACLNLVVDLFRVCFISLCLRVAVFLNATRRDRNLYRSTLREIMDQRNSLRRRKGVLVRRVPQELKFVYYVSG